MSQSLQSMVKGFSKIAEQQEDRFLASSAEKLLSRRHQQVTEEAKKGNKSVIVLSSKEKVWGQGSLVTTSTFIQRLQEGM